MAKQTILLLVLISLLLLSNLFWWVTDYRKTKSAAYHATQLCEQKELLYCLRNFPMGMAFSAFEKTIQKHKMEVVNKWSNDGVQVVAIQNKFEECPDSGRPYCGINFSFKQDLLMDIQAGYPCH